MKDVASFIKVNTLSSNMNHVREQIGGGGEFEALNIVTRALALSEGYQINNTTYFWFTDVCRSALSHYITHVNSFMNEDPLGLTQRMLSMDDVRM